MSEEALKFLFNSLVLIALLLAVYYLVLKFNLRLKPAKKGEIEVIDRYPLDRESSLILFRVKDREFLCYHSKGEMKVLREWNYEETRNSSTASGVDSG